VSHASTQSGLQLVVRSDGTAEVSAEDAQPLIGAGWKRLADDAVVQSASRW